MACIHGLCVDAHAQSQAGWAIAHNRVVLDARLLVARLAVAVVFRPCCWVWRYESRGMMRDFLERLLLDSPALGIVIAMVGVFALIVVAMPAPLIVKIIIAFILGLLAIYALD